MLVPLSYLSRYFQSSIKEDAMILQHVATIMERVVPLIEYPDAEFLSQLEKDLTTPLYKQGMAVIQSCIKCLPMYGCQ